MLLASCFVVRDDGILRARATAMQHRFGLFYPCISPTVIVLVAMYQVADTLGYMIPGIYNKQQF